MGKIHFSSDAARERYVHCRKATMARGDNSLYECMRSLKRWRQPIRIGCDFDPYSFSFAEILADGRCGVCGGIIYHGARDGFGGGTAPTFSVTLDQAEGYRIHT